MGSAGTDMKEEGTHIKRGRKYSVISAPGCTAPECVKDYKGKCVAIVFYPEKKLFTLGIKEFAAQREKFNEENCKVIACTADSSWATWSTSVGLTLRGEMAAANPDKIREEAFLPDPTSYDIQTVSMVMLDEKQCTRPSELQTDDRREGFPEKSFDRFKRASFYDLG